MTCTSGLITLTLSSGFEVLWVKVEVDSWRTAFPSDPKQVPHVGLHVEFLGPYQLRK